MRRTFDGGAGIVRVRDCTITPFWAELAVVDEYHFNQSTPDNELFGVYHLPVLKEDRACPPPL